jgi:hypothetical protein
MDSHASAEAALLLTAETAQAPSWHATANARASRPLGARDAPGRLMSGMFRARMSQAPPGEGSGGVLRIDAIAAAALRLEEDDLDAVDERRSLAESEGRDFSL